MTIVSNSFFNFYSICIDLYTPEVMLQIFKIIFLVIMCSRGSFKISLESFRIKSPSVNGKAWDQVHDKRNNKINLNG